MNMYNIIYKKRCNEVLSKEEIEFFIDKYSKEEIPDYQASALIMAMFINGINHEELVYMTKAMIESGEKIEIPEIKKIVIDKHSTGGVGDKTSFVVSSLLASYGFAVAKMSGRGLGFTGGTLDKLESIPGFKINISNDDFINQVNEVGLSIIGQTKNLVPADKKLYALRDVTATVDNIELIASSIMSKKLACHSDGIILDVKVGSGAFMKTIADAEKLAKTMVDLGNSFNRKTVAVLTNMDDPLGNAVGNSLEVKEAVETLRGNGPLDFNELCLTLTKTIISKYEPDKDIKEIEEKLQKLIDTGIALEKFKEFIAAQGGDIETINDLDKLPIAKHKKTYIASKRGVIKYIDTEKIGMAAVSLGAGRRKKEDSIDYGSGFYFHKKLGNRVNKGDIILDIYYNDENSYEEAKNIIDEALKIDENIESFKKKIIHKIIN